MSRCLIDRNYSHIIVLIGELRWYYQRVTCISDMHFDHPDEELYLPEKGLKPLLYWTAVQLQCVVV
jgi:hypothetical protein